jgi:hypothetical protein
MKAILSGMFSSVKGTLKNFKILVGVSKKGGVVGIFHRKVKITGGANGWLNASPGPSAGVADNDEISIGPPKGGGYEGKCLRHRERLYGPLNASEAHR